MTKEQIALLLIPVFTFLWLQKSTITAGNRQYSIHYKTHLLIKKKGLTRIIYFKPKHFHRYSLFEVLSFFLSYLQLIAFLIIFCFSFYYSQLSVIGLYVACGFLLFSFFGEFARILYINISNHIEEKNMPIQKSTVEVPNGIKTKIDKKLYNSILNNSQKIRWKLESAYETHLSKIKKDDYDAIEKVDDQFIQYFKDYKFVDVENKKVIYSNGKFCRFKIIFSIDGNAKSTFPNLNDKTYRPHFVINGTKEYLGFAFESSTINNFDVEGEAIVRTLYFINRYKDFIPNVEFTIREGSKIVGKGKIVKKYDNEYCQ